jgi:hypothetical protein
MPVGVSAIEAPAFAEGVFCVYRSTEAGKRLIHLAKAFNSDGFEVVRADTYNGRLGITAESRTVVNYDTGRPKRAYYIEGTPYEMGYLMGKMAEDEIARMMEFTDRVIFSFIGSKVLEKMKLVQGILIKVVHELSKKTWQKMPPEITEEIRGIYDGCRSRNPKTRVDLQRLIVLSTGIDTICSVVYSGKFLKRTLEGIEPEDFDIPMMCNAFVASGRSAGNGCFFGRDFTFPTAGVFQDTCAYILYSPVTLGEGYDNGYKNDPVSGILAERRNAPIQFLNIAAPGMVGSIAAMNLKGVALGVDMSPGANCDPENIGINSLIMTRLCVQYGKNAEDAAALMAELPKGVSWLYIIADGTGRSCIGEAGASWPEPDFTQYADEEYRPLLPDMEFIRSHASVPYRNGVMFRWNDYKYPHEYLSFNRQLWDHYNVKKKTDKSIYPDAFDKTAYINRIGDHNCPSTYYFPPQREDSDELLVASNHCIIPEMRYFAMHRWTQRVIGKRTDDIQWRYDELNRQIYDRLAEKGSIGFGDAKELISFLAPCGKYKDYYADNPQSSDGKETRIEGCVSVFDLKNMAVESHYGYYCDEWVRISPARYF